MHNSIVLDKIMELLVYWPDLRFILARVASNQVRSLNGSRKISYKWSRKLGSDLIFDITLREQSRSYI